MSQSKRAYLEGLLQTYQSNRMYIEKQVASYGGDQNATLKHQNDLDSINKKIADILKELGNTIPDDATHIDIWTRTGSVSPNKHHEQLDWVAEFDPDPPAPEIWEQQLLPQLDQLVVRCSKGSSIVALHPRAHISAAIAFGYTFPTTSRYQLWVEQKQDEWWRTDSVVHTALILNDAIIPTDEQQTDWSVEISVARDVRADVTDALKELSLPIGRRMQLSAPHIPHMISESAEAKAIAEQIRKVFIKVRSESRRRPIHLFASVPVALAVLIGAHLSACGPIQCYEHRREQGDYVPACLLRG